MPGCAGSTRRDGTVSVRQSDLNMRKAGSGLRAPHSSARCRVQLRAMPQVPAAADLVDWARQTTVSAVDAVTSTPAAQQAAQRITDIVNSSDHPSIAASILQQLSQSSGSQIGVAQLQTAVTTAVAAAVQPSVELLSKLQVADASGAAAAIAQFSGMDASLLSRAAADAATSLSNTAADALQSHHPSIAASVLKNLAQQESFQQLQSSLMQQDILTNILQQDFVKNMMQQDALKSVSQQNELLSRVMENEGLSSFMSNMQSTIGGVVESLRASSPPQLIASVQTTAASVWQALLESKALNGAALLQQQTQQSGTVSFDAMLSTAFSTAAAGSPGSMLSMLTADTAAHAPEIAALTAAAATAVGAASVRADARSNKWITASDSELPTSYDIDAIMQYWSTRPVILAKRSMQTAAIVTYFLVAILYDLNTGNLKKNEKKRARALRMAVDSLGPAYIKVAQAVSTRSDILSNAYFDEIQYLQDQVQPFDSREAYEILRTELGCDPTEVYEYLSEEPIAAASLGQVYKGRLRAEYGGAEVAVKVQRPGVLEMVALDLVLMRRTIIILQQLFPDMTRGTEIIPVLDEWATKFFREMDYRQEAATMSVFARDMQPFPGIKVPQVYDNLTTRRVLHTEWIDGEKLSESNAADVRQLCSTLLNAYLVQLLDTGLLHADPHPGNLIRTPDGKICIIDYGLMTEVPADLRIALLEYIAHLSVGDWSKLGDDLVKLQFVTEDSKNPNEIDGLMDSIGAVMDLLMEGGGAGTIEPSKMVEISELLNIDMDAVAEKGFMDGFATIIDSLADATSKATGKDFGNFDSRSMMLKVEALREQITFRLPPYFVLILRCFSVIEGIALRVDPKYSIIRECFPFLAKKLLTEDDPRVRKALRQILYPDGGSRINLARFQKLFVSLQQFGGFDGLTLTGGRAVMAQQLPAATVVAAAAPAPLSVNARPGDVAAVVTGGSMVPTAAVAAQPVLDRNTVEALQIVFSTNGSYLQELLVAELAATVEALSRSAAIRLLQIALQSTAASATLSAVQALGPLRPFVLPVTLPVEFLARAAPVVQLTKDDEIAISNVRTIWSILQPQISAVIGDREMRLALLRAFSSSMAELGPAATPQLLFGVNRTAELVARQVVRNTAARFAQDMAAYTAVSRGQPSTTAAGLPAAAAMPSAMVGSSNATRKWQP